MVVPNLEILILEVIGKSLKKNKWREIRERNNGQTKKGMISKRRLYINNVPFPMLALNFKGLAFVVHEKNEKVLLERKKN